MNRNYKANERELVKVAIYFKKQSKKLIDAGKIGEENRKVEEAVDKFIGHLDQHANARASILEQRDYLKTLVKDNARCPQCQSADMLKPAGTELNEKGWKSNRYKCRKCNIFFTWNMPNNPWDMVAYIQEVMDTMRLRYAGAAATDSDKEQALTAIDGMQANLDKLKPVIDAHDKEYEAFESREEEMERLVHEFKNSLLIEKIKMDTWENKSK